MTRHRGVYHPASSYWARYLQPRTRRRRVLGGMLCLAGAVSAATILGCGDDDGGDAGEATGSGPTTGAPTGGTSSTGASGLLPAPVDTSAQAVRGGTLHSNIANSVSLEPITGLHGGFKVQNSPLFNRIFQAEPGILEPSKGVIAGDAAQSWEMSGDRMQLTVKLRPNLGTDPRPPVNGRNLDAQDVLWSWNLFAAESTVRATLVNSVDPNSPVDRVEAPDDQTVVFHLAFPSTLLEGYLADGFYFWIVPKDAENYDQKNEAHGAGPWYNEVFEPDVKFRMARNPNYYSPELPYLDAIEFPVLSEPAALLAQLETGAIDISGTVYGLAGIENVNVLDVYDRHPEMTLFEVPGNGAGRHLRVGFAEGSPFRDLRMRQALSMLMNRADLAEYFTNASQLHDQGLPAEATWVSHLAPFYPDALDLRDPFFDPHRQIFEHNPDEAKKLMDAAGYDGEPLLVMYSTGSQSERDGNVMAEQIRGAGIAAEELILDINQEFVPTVTRRRGDYAGIAVHTMLAGYDVGHYIYTNLHPIAETTSYPTREDFPELTALNDAILGEFDANRRSELTREWMLQAAKDLPSIPAGAIGPTYHLAWPWIQNVGVFQRWLGTSVNNVETFIHYWYDASKDTRPS